jgi:hypothetical protein
VLTNLERDQGIARFYDLLDLPSEDSWYRRVRPLLFDSLSDEYQMQVLALIIFRN